MEITLALGGGGSRGAAHIGVLRMLEREGCRVRGIAGTSVGSIIAALYADGYSPDEIESLVAAIDFTRLYGRLLSDGPGLLGVTGIHRWLDAHLSHKNFSDLRIPCSIVAVDLGTHRQVNLQQGSVVDAILGSIALPGIFPPHNYGDFRLIDGGTLDPVPVRAARALAPGIPNVAVILSIPPDAPHPPLRLPISVPQLITNRLTRFRISQAFGIFLEAVDIGQRSLTALRLETDKPEVLVRPDITGIAFLGDVDVHGVVKRGENAALVAMPDIRRACSWQGRFLRRFNLRGMQ